MVSPEYMADRMGNSVYKMMIVEDELFVRIGLEHAINWTDYGIQLLPSASDGLEALARYEKEHPHLILTDIRMPRMNGLELISAIRAKDKNVKFIVVSCLEDFQTIKQALNLSISHYYNKSELNIEELTQYVSEIVQELKQTGVPSAPAQQEMDLNTEERKKWEEFFFEGKPIDPEPLLQKYQKDNCVHLLVRMQFSEEANTDFTTVLSVLEDILNKQKTGHCLTASPQQAVLLYTIENEPMEHMIEQMDIIKHHLELSMQSYFHITVTITVSSPFSKSTQLYDRFQEAEHFTTDFTAKQVVSRRIKDTVEYIRQNLNGDLTLAAVAQHVNYSPGYLSAIFKQELNTSFSDYIVQLRLRSAKLLLTQSDAPLYSIAEQTGFHDASYFVKVFKKYVGLTPNDYRMAHSVSVGRKI